MDKHHKRLLLIINQLFFDIQKEPKSEKIKEILTHLKKYTEKHLDIEESLLKKVNYPDIEKHIYAHNEMRGKVKEILTFLKNWWINHIKIMDKKYEPYIKGADAGS